MRLNITYATSNEYVKYAGISMTSLLENNKEIGEIVIYYIGDDISKENKQILNNLVHKYRRKIVFMEFRDLSSEIGDLKRMSRTTYGKLFLSNFIKEDKIIHIDSDTMILGSLYELGEMNMGNYLAAGVLDCVNDYNRIAAGLDLNDNYINGGVVVFNLKKWREEGLEEKVRDICKISRGKLPNFDQGILNYICRGRLLILNPEYNLLPQMLSFNKKKIERLYQLNHYYTEGQIKEAKLKPIIIHFVTHVYGRPWQKRCIHPYKQSYINYWKKSPWKLELEEDNLKISIHIRRFIYKYMPFVCYQLFEEMLYKKRKRLVYEKYKMIE